MKLRELRSLATLFVMLLLLVTAGPVRAENLGPGGGTRVIVGDQVAGPYRVFFTSAPNPAQVGVVTFVLRVSDPATGARVKDVDASVTLALPGGEQTLSGKVTHEAAASTVDYALHLEILQPGAWNGTLQLKGAAGSAEVQFVQNVAPKRQVGVLIGAGLPFLLLLGILVGIWLGRSKRAQANE